MHNYVKKDRNQLQGSREQAFYCDALLTILYLEPRDAFPVPEWTQKTFDHQQYRCWMFRNKNCFYGGHRCSAFSIPGCSIQKFSLNYDHRVKYLIYLKGAVMTVLCTMFLMKCLKQFSKFNILHFTTHYRSRYPVTKWSHWRETSECHASIAGEGVSEVSKSNCQFLYPQTVW